MTDPCPFCACDASDYSCENEWCFAIHDRYPVTEGHTLVIPKGHVSSIFQLPDPQLAAIWSLVRESRSELAELYRCDDFNVGVNDGSLAGQTIEHAHVHVIPRRTGDVEDPRGGVRRVVPDNAAYWDLS